MKLYALVLAALLLPSAVFAQVAPRETIVNGAADAAAVIQNAEALRQTRWIPMVEIDTLNVAHSTHITSPIDGNLVEFFTTMTGGYAQLSSNTIFISVSVSRFNGAAITAGTVRLTGSAELGVGGRDNAFTAVRINRGDSIVVAVHDQTSTNATNVVASSKIIVTMRVEY